MGIGSVVRASMFSLVVLPSATAQEVEEPWREWASQLVGESGPPVALHPELAAEMVQVVDGDTVDVRIVGALAGRHIREGTCAECENRQRRGRRVLGDTQIRPAGGLDAPDFRRQGGRGDESHAQQAEEFVRHRLRAVRWVFLDVDDGSVPREDGRGACEAHAHPQRDRYCRLLAVILYRDADGYWHNLNEELLEWGQTTLPDTACQNHRWLRYQGQYPTEFEVAGHCSGCAQRRADGR